MYKIEIDIADWDFGVETVTVETVDFDKIAIIREFIELQKDYGWCVDYGVVEVEEYETEEVEEEEVEEEEYEIGDWYYAEDGTVWERIE